MKFDAFISYNHAAVGALAPTLQTGLHRLARPWYAPDAPTIGLHMADVEKLIHVLRRRVCGDHSTVVIKHDFNDSAGADWVNDRGVEGGGECGRMVAAASPDAVVAAGTHTGRPLEPVLAPGR